MCTLEKRGNIFLLTLTGPSDHRLNPILLTSLRSALSRIISSSPLPNSALVTCAEGKFFSNGFDQSWAKSAPLSELHVMSEGLRHLIFDLLSLPMPTICAVTGHVAAGAVTLMLAHDYVVMRHDRGYFYMSELDVGLKFVEYFRVMFKEKIPDNMTRRDVLLKAEKLRARDAVARGIVDLAAEGGVEGTVEEAIRMAGEVSAGVRDGAKLAEKRKLMFPETWKHVSLGLTSKL